MLNQFIAYGISLGFILTVCLLTVDCQLLRPDHMNLGGGDHDHKKHGEKLIGGDDHDFRPHGKRLIGSGDHDYTPHNSKLIGGDDHDYEPHNKKLIGGDDHDYKPHNKKLIGGDDHDYKPHNKKLIGGDDHDYKLHNKKLIGGDDHDYKPHNKKLIGGDDHDYKPHNKKLIGGDDHDYKPHNKKLIGGDDHDYKPHNKKLIGGDDHDYRLHGKKHHNKKLGREDHDYKQHNKKLIGGGDHDYREHHKKVGKRNYNFKQHNKKLIGTGDHDYMPHIKNGKKKGKYSKFFLFNQFTKTFNKSYKSKHETKKRFKIFKDNMRKAKLLQSNEQGTARYGMTKFSDMTGEEFRRLLGLRLDLQPSPSFLTKITKLSSDYSNAPHKFDWRTMDVVTPVKNQGMCGSCWAFSVTGNVEGQYAIKYKKLYSLSEQELVDCDELDDGCDGGMPENAYEAIQNLGGLETEAAYPYDGVDKKCHFDNSKVKVNVNGSVELPQDEEMIKQWLFKDGPISIGINANMLQFYSGGVSHPPKFMCNPKDLDHGVLIVGYGVHTTKYTHRTQPFWLIKNSWGEDWGEKGYFRVYRGDGTCGVNMMATSSIVV